MDLKAGQAVTHYLNGQGTIKRVRYEVPTSVYSEFVTFLRGWKIAGTQKERCAALTKERGLSGLLKTVDG